MGKKRLMIAAVVVLLLAGTGVAAIAMYHAVEVPARRWMRGVGNLKTPWTEVR